MTNTFCRLFCHQTIMRQSVCRLICRLNLFKLKIWMANFYATNKLGDKTLCGLSSFYFSYINALLIRYFTHTSNSFIFFSNLQLIHLLIIKNSPFKSSIYYINHTSILFFPPVTFSGIFRWDFLSFSSIFDSKLCNFVVFMNFFC